MLPLGRWHTSAIYLLLEKKFKKTKCSLGYDLNSHHHDGHFGDGRLTSSVCGAAPLRHVHFGGGMQGSGLARAVHDCNENLQLSATCRPMGRPLCCSCVYTHFLCLPSVIGGGAPAAAVVAFDCVCFAKANEKWHVAEAAADQ